MKKLHAIFILSSLSCTLTANHSFYIGTSLNGSFLTEKRNDLAKNTNDTKIVFSDNKKIYKQSVYAGILAGYLFRFKNIGIGPECSYSIGKSEINVDGLFEDVAGPYATTFKITHKTTDQFNIHARIGYFFNNYFLYTLAGIHYQTSQSQAKATRIEPRGQPTVSFIYKSGRKRMSTFSFGLGIQKPITENCMIGLEYKMAQFPSKNFTFTLNDPDKTTLTSSFKYQLRSVGLKLMYVF